MQEPPHLRQAEVLDLGAGHLDEVRIDVERVDRGDQGLIVQVLRDVPERAADLEHAEPRGASPGQVAEETLEEIAAACLLEGEVEGGPVDALALDQHPDEALGVVGSVLAPFNLQDALAPAVLDRVWTPPWLHWGRLEA